jgi:dihydroorotate dehydrogenase
MFRAAADQALVNRMGFNNAGAQAVAKRLASWKARGLWPKSPVGINLGKSKITPNNEAAEDYRQSLAALWPLADFFVINVSSPNTPNLRELQDRDALDQVLAAAQSENRKQAASLRPKPLLVKIAPDLTFSAIDELLEVAAKHQLAGIVATNTTIERPAGSDEQCRKTYSETGGLSGAPLRQRSTEIIRYIFNRTEGRLPIVGVGGIFNAEHAWEKIRAGASLVQCYTGLVYEGPSIARNIVSGLADRLRAEGYQSIHSAIGGSPAIATNDLRSAEAQRL